MKFKVLLLTAVLGILSSVTSNFALADAEVGNVVIAKGHGSYTSYSNGEITTPEIIGAATQTALKNAISQAKYLCGSTGSVTPAEIKTDISPVYHTERTTCPFPPRFCSPENENWTILVTVEGNFTCNN